VSSTVIKEVEGKRIFLMESSEPSNERSILSVLFSILFVIGLIGVALAFILLFKRAPNHELFIGSLLVCMGSAIVSWFDIGKKRVDVYRIGLFEGEDITITRTTPEADQAAVCKAVKEMEKRAWEMRKKERELERIAANCK
jgi:hypothetical protein